MDDLNPVDDFNPYAAPETSTSPQHLATEADEGRGVWRDGKILVMSKVARLPSRCIKCNEPATYRLKRTLSWHHPGYYFLILTGLCIYVIIALIIQETAKIQIPLCERHRRKRRNAILTNWLVALSGFALLFAPAFNSDLVPLVFLGILMIIGSLFAAVFLAVVTPKKIDKTHVWLDKVGPFYLASLPPLPVGDDAKKDEPIFLDEI